MMLHEGNLTPTAARAAERSRRFHAHIAQQAAKVVVPTNRSYFIPNVPFGIPKARPKPRLRPIDLAMHCRGMWFYDLIWPSPKGADSRLEIIIRTVARNYGLSRAQLTSQRRIAKEVVPRQLAMYLCKELTGKSLPEIGRRMGGKDHTTVIHAIRRTRQRIERSPEFAARCDAIMLELRS